MADRRQDHMSSLSKRLPPFLIEQYERTLALLNITPPRPFLNTPEQFLNLYSQLDSKRSSFTPPPSGDMKYFALTYTYHILKGLGWDETDLKSFVIRDLIIDSKVTQLLSSLKGEIIKEIMDIIGKLDLQLGNFQLERYQLALCVLTEKGDLSSDNTFSEMYGVIKTKLGGSDWESLAFTACVLERSGWGNTKNLRLFSIPNVTLEEPKFQKVDLSLVVADYFGNMTDRDFRSAKVLISTLHLEGRNVGKLSIVDFTLLLINSNKVEPGNVSIIEDKLRYPHYFESYKKRHEEAKKLSQEVTLTQSVTQNNMVTPKEETVYNPSTTTELSMKDISTPVLCTNEDEKEKDGHRPTQATTTTSNNTVSGTTVLSDSGGRVENATKLSYQITAHSERGGVGDTIDDMPS